MTGPRISPLHSAHYHGDKRAGCACTYVFMEQVPSPRGGYQPAPTGGRRARQTSNVDGIANVDVFASSTGATAHKFLCHRGLTGAEPSPMESPPTYEPKTFLGVLFGIGRAVKKAFWSVFRCFVPRVNVGVGINLWRFNV